MARKPPGGRGCASSQPLPAPASCSKPLEGLLQMRMGVVAASPPPTRALRQVLSAPLAVRADSRTGSMGHFPELGAGAGECVSYGTHMGLGSVSSPSQAKICEPS